MRRAIARSTIVVAVALTVAVSAATAAVRPDGETANDPLKVAYIYNGKINDGGWNTVQDAGRKAVQKQFGNRIETTFKESVPETPQATQVIDSLVAGGAKLIFATSFGYHQFVVAAAKKYPDVKFAQFSSTELGPNLMEYTLDPTGSFYLAGMALAALSKTGKLGMIAPFPIPQDIGHVNSFTLGARAVNPRATVKVLWIGSFFDPAKESLDAKAMLSSGVDAIASDMGDPAIDSVANSAGVPWTGTVSDQRTFGPKTYVTSTLYTWGPLEAGVTKSVLDGTFKSQSLISDMSDSVTDVARWGAAYGKVRASVKSRIAATRKAFRAGSRSPWAGPIKDQSGKTRVAAGTTLSPTKVQLMNWLVDGAIGSAK